jgi:hypothetical protein
VRIDAWRRTPPGAGRDAGSDVPGRLRAERQDERLMALKLLHGAEDRRGKVAKAIAEGCGRPAATT